MDPRIDTTKKRLLIESIILVIGAIFWCELGYYYFVNYRYCSHWPEAGSSNIDEHANFTHILVVADTHIMGQIKSYKLDKLLREWQMKQTYWISNRILKPDLIIFIGDLLDEGYFTHDFMFKEASKDFERVFANTSDKNQPVRIILPGNHDVGFHDHMTHYDYYLRRFLKTFQSFPYIERIETNDNLKHLNLIVANSMMLYNDSCPFCSMMIKETNYLADKLKREEYYHQNSYAEPILFKHIPLYRKDDSICMYPSSLKEKVLKENVPGIDVLHKKASNFLLAKIRPRLIVSGHTHMECLTKHKIASEILQSTSKNNFEEDKTFDEITVSSYNHKYAELKPGYLLISLNSTHLYHRHCDMINESIVISVYIIFLIVIISRWLLSIGEEGVKDEELLAANDQ